MKDSPNFLLLVVALLLGSACQAGAPQKSAVGSSATSARVPVVLELFTSEGCSSCPPADALLAKLEQEQPISGAEIVALEEHVDYWDQQGWNDPFSSAQWTQRQQAYASGFADHGVYTPELVIDGRSALVGSHGGDAYRAIVNAATTQPRTEVSISLLNSDNKPDRQHVKVQIGKLQGAQEGDVAEVWLAITETALHNSVTGGENAGRDLHHAGVARWLHKAGVTDRNAAPSFSGESDLKLDSKWKRPNLRVIAFVQEKRSRHILGAAVARVEP
jgi:hypothetical protein